MKISVIIPFYNNAQSIERALNSVQRQSVKPQEVILINDASPDWMEIESKLDDFTSLNLKTIHHKSNKNGAAARNSGIIAAKGEYIAFLDADDEWYPDHLEKSFHFLKSENLDICTAKCQIIKSNGIFISPTKSIKQNERLASYLFVKGQSMYTPTIFMLKSAAKNLLFDDTIKRHQDFDFLLRAEKLGYKISNFDHFGAIVHWEDNDVLKKGETWRFSLEWLEKREKWFNHKERSNFWLQFIGFKILSENRLMFFKQLLKSRANPFLFSRSRMYRLVLMMIKF